jgi:hypothetical protein
MKATIYLSIATYLLGLLTGWFIFRHKDLVPSVTIPKVDSIQNLIENKSKLARFDSLEGKHKEIRLMPKFEQEKRVVLGDTSLSNIKTMFINEMRNN